MISKRKRKSERRTPKKLQRYSDAYYSQNESLISDYEYDMLLKELENLEAELQIQNKDSITQTVGSSLKILNSKNSS